MKVQPLAGLPPLPPGQQSLQQQQALGNVAGSLPSVKKPNQISIPQTGQEGADNGDQPKKVGCFQ